MAKSPWILYGASGKVGNIVLQKSNGKTVIRERVETVKNPRSTDQQTQRMKNATVMAAYSTLKPICDHSFEGVSYGAKSMQFFLKENYKVLNGLENPVFNLRSNKTLMQNPYLISKGSIVTNIEPAIDSSETFAKAFKINLPSTSLATMTVKQFHEACGIEIGDQITLLTAVTLDGAAVNVYGNDSQTDASLIYSRIVFNPEKADSLLLNTAVEEGEVWNPANFAPESLVAPSMRILCMSFTDSGMVEFCPQVNGGQNIAIGCIISRKTDTVWNRSTSYLAPLVGWMSNKSPIYSYLPTGEKFLNNAIV